MLFKVSLSILSDLPKELNSDTLVSLGYYKSVKAVGRDFEGSYRVCVCVSNVFSFLIQFFVRLWSG